MCARSSRARRRVGLARWERSSPGHSSSQPITALNLKVYALGLKDLLDHFEPEYYLPGPRRSAAARLQKELQRRLARYLKRGRINGL